MTADMVSEVTTAQLAPVMLTELQFDSASPTRFWNGYGDLYYNSATYLGIGNMGTLSPIDETTDLSARGIMMQLSGVPTALVAVALSTTYQGKPCSVMIGALSPTAGTLISSPVTVFSGRMDVMNITDDGQSAIITMSAENRLVDFRRTREIRYTDEEQQNLFSGDLGLEFVTAIQEKTIYWGNANASSAIQWTPPESDAGNQP